MYSTALPLSTASFQGRHLPGNQNRVRPLDAHGLPFAPTPSALFGMSVLHHGTAPGKVDFAPRQRAAMRMYRLQGIPGFCRSQALFEKAVLLVGAAPDLG